MKTLFKTILICSILSMVSCQKKDKNSDPGPLIVDTNSVDTNVVNPVRTTVDIQFLLNCGSANERFKFIIADSLTIFNFNKTSDLIAVNTESWACNTEYHTPQTFTDTLYQVGKTYHLKMFVNGDTLNQANNKYVKFSHQSHDFTFQVDTSGAIYNLQTQNLTSCVNHLYQPTNDVVLKCNKIIVNYRLHRSYEETEVVQSEL